MTIMRVPSDHGYSEAVAVQGPGRWVHIAGQIGVEFDGSGSADPIAVQAARALDRLEAALGAVGAGLADVVSITTYVTSFDDWPQVAAVRAERFGPQMPASTAVQVASLMADAAIEISAVACVPAEAG